MLRLFFSLILVSFLSSCYYDVEENLYGSSVCDTTDISYVQDIAPILNTSCNGCHASAINIANVSLDQYAAVKKFVDNGKLIGVIRHDPGFSAMPSGAPKIADCSIQKLEAWLRAGSPNN